MSPFAPCIEDISFRELELELTEPFGISGGSQELAHVVIVRVRLSDGSQGFGEAAPLPAYNGDTVARVLASLTQARAAWLKASALDFARRARDLRAAQLSSPAARGALEMALCDALARRAGCSLYTHFGGRGSATLHSDVTIPIVEPQAAEQAARKWWQAGFRQLKIKVGDEADVERVLAVQRGAPRAELLLDANAALSAEQALARLDRLERSAVKIALFEQPVAAEDWDGLVRVAKRCRVALDESVVTASQATYAASRLGPPHVVNIKLMKSGIAEALDIVDAARAGGLSLMIGGMVETTLAVTVSACFAAGVGGFELADLDTPLFLRQSPFVGGLERNGAEVRLESIELGHGLDAAGVFES